MRKRSKDNEGTVKMVARYRREFRRPENLNHYTPDGYQLAERSFVKYALREGWKLL